MLDNRSIESSVRSYCLAFAEEFDCAYGGKIFSAEGREYIDFLMGCGSLNYGHNHEVLATALKEYIGRRGVAMGLDLVTSAKIRFMDAFRDSILSRRQLDYRIQFTGPTGANAVEAAVKLVRKVTGRHNVVAFTNGFHGCSLGALSLTGSAYHRAHSGPLLTNVTRMPYDGYFGPAVDTAAYLDKMLSDPSSGCDAPAAIIFEAVQGEGGLNVASRQWAQRICEVASKHGALVIVDDIQAGCGRCGDFFSFEALGIRPDLVCLAKSISGFGLPMSLVLLKPELDLWAPGEHNGTFRGNNLAFVTAAAAIETFWADDGFAQEVKNKGAWLEDALRELAATQDLSVKGRGLLLGIDTGDGETAQRLRSACFEQGLIAETCGPHDEVLKLLPPLTVSYDELNAALSILRAAFRQVYGADRPAVESRLAEVVK